MRSSSAGAYEKNNRFLLTTDDDEEDIEEGHVDFSGILVGVGGQIGATFSAYKLLTPEAVLKNWVVFAFMAIILVSGTYFGIQGYMKDKRDHVRAIQVKKNENELRLTMTADERKSNLIESSTPDFMKHNESFRSNFFTQFRKKHDIFSYFKEYSPVKNRQSRVAYIVITILSFM